MDKIFKLISKSHSRKLEKYLKKYPEKIETPNEYDATPLLFAMETYQRDCAIVLLNHGANPNVCSSVDGITPLAYAENRRDIELINLLLNREKVHLAKIDTQIVLSDESKKELNNTLFRVLSNISKESDRIYEALDTVIEELSTCLGVLESDEEDTNN